MARAVTPALGDQRGMALVMTCMTIALITAFGTAMMVQGLTEQQTAARYCDLAAAFNMAESGVDQALVNLHAGQSSNLPVTAMVGGSYWAEVESLGGVLYKITSHGLVGQSQRNIEVVASVTSG